MAESAGPIGFSEKFVDGLGEGLGVAGRNQYAGTTVGKQSIESGHFAHDGGNAMRQGEEQWVSGCGNE